MSDASTYTTIGAILAVSASICNAIGYTVQKIGHNKLKQYNKDKSEDEKKRLIKEKTWASGFAIYLIGGLLNAVSLFYAPQSLVLPLSAITLVANTFLATKILNEPFKRTDIFGVLCVMIGSILAVIFGPRTAGGDTTMNELKLRWRAPDFYLFFLVLSCCIVCDYIIVRILERKNSNDETVTDELKHGSSCLLLSYCLLAGYFGSLAFLFLKAFTEFIGSSASSKMTAKQNAINWYSYFTLICVVLTNFALEFFRQRGLAYFHAVYVVPINQVVLIVMGTVLGGLYFEEFDNLSSVNAAMFTIAILMTVMGVFVLAFNSGNVSDKTEAKINHTITLSVDVSNINNLGPISLPNLPSMLQTSPSLPITRTRNSEIPDLPPPGMAGTIARIHGLHRSMASMHFTKDKKPFYLDKNTNKLSVLSVIGVSSVDTSVRNIFDGFRKNESNDDTKVHNNSNGYHSNYKNNKTRHIKHSQSLPTYSNSSLEIVIANSPMQLGVKSDLRKITENSLDFNCTDLNSEMETNTAENTNESTENENEVHTKTVRFKDLISENSDLPTKSKEDIESDIVTKESISITDYKKSNEL